MNLRKRGLVFSTFVGSCVSLALVLAALSTRQWVVAAAARRTTIGDAGGGSGGASAVAVAPDARGRVALGLFSGRRHLNVGYGWRAYEVDVVQEARVDPSLLHLGLWTATVAALGGALLLSALCGLLAVLNAAASPGAPLCALPGLYLWNTLAMLLQLTAAGLWVAQFEMHLRHNVMSREDRENKWDSDGMATLGASFWFVVGAAFVHALNLLAIYCGTRPPKDKTIPTPILEEKGNGAIMLY